MSVFKRLASQTAIYGLSSVLGRMLNYLLVPLYTAVFDPGAYGVVTELYAYIAFLNILYVYGLETAYFRFSKEGDHYFHIAFTSVLLSSVVFSGLLWIFSNQIASFLSYPENGYFIEWLAAILAIDAIVTIPFARLREEGKAAKFAVFKLSNIGVNILLNLFFVVLCPLFFAKNPTGFLQFMYNPSLGVGYVFLSNLLANSLYLLFFISTWKKIKLKFDTKVWKQMMRYALPILIIGFAGVTNEMFSRAILKYRLPEGFYSGYSNLEILGIFGACYKLSVFMTLTVQSFRYAFEPFFFAHVKEKNSAEVFSKIMTYSVLLTSIAWLFLSLYMPYYAPIFLRQESYLVALEAVPWLLGGGLFLGVFYNLSLWYKLTDKTHYGAYISLAGALITLALNWILIPHYGYMGSAYATFICYTAISVISYLGGQKHYPIPYQVVKVLSFILLSAAGIFLNKYLGSGFNIASGIFILYLTLVAIIERKSLRQLRIENFV